MAEEKFVVAGIDISDDVTQVAFYVTGMDEPKMTGDRVKENDFLIPTAIENYGDGWVVGSACRKPVLNLFSKARYGIKRVFGDYDALKLLAVFAEQMVRLVISESGENKLDVVTIALQKTDKEIINVMRKHFIENGLGGIKLIFITHAESSIYYVLNQKKELRINDIAFFDFSKEYLIYRKMHMVRLGKKNVVEVTETDCTSRCNYIGRTDEIFKNLAAELFDRQHVATVYLIGEGFENEAWAKESLNYMCNRRRVFKGRNLYAIGACYKSLDGFDKYSYDTYCILAKGRTEYETCIEVVFKGERNEAVLINAGSLWYEEATSLEGILNNITKISIIVHNIFGDVVKTEEISLEDFPYRNDRMTRIKIDAILQNEGETQITITDLGFGEFAANSGLQITKSIYY